MSPEPSPERWQQFWLAIDGWEQYWAEFWGYIYEEIRP